MHRLCSIAQSRCILQWQHEIRKILGASDEHGAPQDSTDWQQKSNPPATSSSCHVDLAHVCLLLALVAKEQVHHCRQHIVVDCHLLLLLLFLLKSSCKLCCKYWMHSKHADRQMSSTHRQQVNSLWAGRMVKTWARDGKVATVTTKVYQLFLLIQSKLCSVHHLCPAGPLVTVPWFHAALGTSGR